MTHCERCCSRDVLNVALDLSGDPVKFSHCRACEHRWWTRPAGTAIALNDVLEAVGA